MNNYLKRILIVLLATMQVWALQAAGANDITINHTTRELVAPAGESFQWYHHGKVIAGAVAGTFSPEESGAYRVEVTDITGNITSRSITVKVTATGIRKIHLIGDSTVSNYNGSQYPFMGWGQVLQLFFEDSSIQVQNHARGGRSSRSFYEEGLWTPVENALDSNDYVFIQFGHNDRDFSKPERYTSPDSMKHFLRIYINDSRAKGAIPVLVSPMSMNTGTRNVFTESGNDYRGAMVDVSAELNVPLIDLNLKSYDFYQQIGVEYAKYFVHMGLEPGEYPNYPTGYTDFWTHYQEMGALTMCRFISEEINDQQADPQLAFLGNALKPLYPVSVSLSKPNAGVSTVDGAYPAGANVTLKARLTDENDVVKYWADSSHNLVLNGNLVSFTMDPHDYDVVGYIADCDGTANGTATIDACGICSGGQTGIAACTQSIPCADLCETNANVELMLDPDELYHLVLSTDGIAQGYLSQDVSVSVSDTFVFEMTYDNPTPGESINMYVDDDLKVSADPLVVTTDWEVKRFSLYLEAGEHTIRIQNNSATGGARYDFLALFSQDISGTTCTKTHAQETFFAPSDNLIVIEAENYTELLPASNGTNWRKALMTDASSGAVVLAPDEVTYGSASTARNNAPVTRYRVHFPDAGDYAVWARVYAFDPGRDSYHLGLDEQVLVETIDLFNSTNVYETFTWMHVADKKLTVASAGVHDLDLFCREPNLIIDKVILSLDATYSPSGNGPAETQSDPITSLISLAAANDPGLALVAYPNPATSELHIDYQIPEAGLVNLSVYDATGQKIQDLVSGHQQEKRQHLNWKLDSNPDIVSGLYLILLQTAHTTQVQKILIER
jgi:lysophospholipase L1-like esterase